MVIVSGSLLAIYLSTCATVYMKNYIDIRQTRMYLYPQRAISITSTRSQSRMQQMKITHSDFCFPIVTASSHDAVFRPIG